MNKIFTCIFSNFKFICKKEADDDVNDLKRLRSHFMTWSLIVCIRFYSINCAIFSKKNLHYFGFENFYF